MAGAYPTTETIRKAWQTYKERCMELSGSEACEAQAEYVPQKNAENTYVGSTSETDDEYEITGTFPHMHIRKKDAASTNPKDLAAVGRCPLWLVPPEARRQEARVLEHGASKYGPYNWRQESILLSNYLSAAERHLAAFIDGQDNDTESGLSHLAHARATLGIIIDAMTHGMVIDDRPGKQRAHHNSR